MLTILSFNTNIMPTNHKTFNFEGGDERVAAIAPIKTTSNFSNNIWWIDFSRFVKYLRIFGFMNIEHALIIYNQPDRNSSIQFSLLNSIFQQSRSLFVHSTTFPLPRVFNSHSVRSSNIQSGVPTPFFFCCRVIINVAIFVVMFNVLNLKILSYFTI